MACQPRRLVAVFVPVGALALLTGLWSVRRRWRGPLAAMLFFVGTLFPVLGFCNVYPFRFSFVADHFQYLASLGVITLTSAGAAILLDRWRIWGRWPAYCLCGVLLLVLATCTWTQCWMYTEIDRLYITTLERNPDCWMAYNNLGLLFFEQGEYDKAIECYNRTIGIKPEYEEAHLNLGASLNRLGQFDLAIAQYRIALANRSDSAEAHFGLGNVFLAKNEFDKAAREYQAALAIRHDFIEAHCNLGNVLTRRGQAAEAIVEYRKALEVNPDHSGAHCNLANALLILGQYDEAITEYRKALAVRPDFPEAQQNLDTILAHLDEIKAERLDRKPAKPKP
jgi:protein O-mannosyl-transferase